MFECRVTQPSKPVQRGKGIEEELNRSRNKSSNSNSNNNNTTNQVSGWNEFRSQQRSITG